jgi:hypothetical protein
MKNNEKILELIKMLKSETCSVCGSKKDYGKVFCIACFSSLPIWGQQNLYLKMGHGFEQAVKAAIRYLTDLDRKQTDLEG